MQTADIREYARDDDRAYSRGQRSGNRSAFATLRETAQTWVAADGVPSESVVRSNTPCRRRYIGQEHSVTIALDFGATPEDSSDKDAFDAMHSSVTRQRAGGSQEFVTSRSVVGSCASRSPGRLL